MIQCDECGKRLSNRASLRVHINSQHRQDRWHFCECGRPFLDPAGRSRCRSRHARSYGCSAPGCSYRNSRKDSVTQHIKRRHQSFLDLQVLTLPPNSGDWDPTFSPHFEFNPAPPIPVNHMDFLPAVPDFSPPPLDSETAYLYSSQASTYYPETSTSPEGFWLVELAQRPLDAFL